MRRVLLVVALVGVVLAAPAVYHLLVPPAHPPVLLITIDTLRVDAVGPETPALQAFLSTARHFRGARTVAPLTVPAHTSLLSGLLPARHRIHDNVASPDPDRGFPLLAREMREASYDTAAFVAHGVLGREAGLTGGFAHYTCAATDASPGGYAPADEQVDAALAWLEARNTKKPYFLWVHLFDPHGPYRPYPGDERRPKSSGFDADRDLYLGEVRRVDAAVERLLAAVGPDAVVVIASDHGESLGDHGEDTHGSLCYGSTVDAFLAVRAHGYGAGTTDDAPRSLCDVAPSLRRLCDLPPQESDGLPLLGPPPEVVLTESVYVWRIHGWGQCFAATDGRFTLVESGPRLELFDRKTDPHERTPLPVAGVPAFEKLDRALMAMRQGSPGAPDNRTRHDVAAYAAARRPFTAYLDRRENARRPDPRPLVKTWTRFLAVPGAIAFYVARRDVAGLEETLGALRAYAGEMAGSPVPFQYIAAVQAEIGRLTGDRSRYAQATREQLRAIELGFTLPDALHLALTYADLSGDPDLVRTVLAVADAHGVPAADLRGPPPAILALAAH